MQVFAILSGLMPEAELHSEVKKALEAHSIRYEILPCDPNLADTAAFCAHYGYTLDQSANTILVASRKIEPPKYAACLVLANTKLDVNKKVCQLLGVKRASFADSGATQRLSGMMVGGVTAIGIENMPIYVDAAVLRQQHIIMGGGNRSSKLSLDPEELTKLPNVQIITELAKPK